MQKRLALFVALSIVIWLGNAWLIKMLYPPPPPKAKPPAVAEQPKAGEGEQPAPDKQPADNQASDKQPGEPAADDQAPLAADEPPAQMVAAQPALPTTWATLGSADPHSGYRMLVTLTSRGAAVNRAVLNSPRYREIDDWNHKGGSLGCFPIPTDPPDEGALVPVVGPGTPAEDAGLLPDDVIVEIDGMPIRTPEMLHLYLQGTEPGQKVKLLVLREGAQTGLSATLGHRQLGVVEPENDDPLSLLLTFEQLGNQKLSGPDELPGLEMRTGNWELLPGNNADEAAFRWPLPGQNLEVIKRYKLAKAPDEAIDDVDYPAYHVNFTIEIRNTAEAESEKLAYRLDGPTGLPVEGAWYASRNKIGRNWGSTGMRDFATESLNGRFTNIGQITCSTIAEQKYLEAPTDTHDIWQDQPLVYVGVDAQYFAGVLLPQAKDPQAVDFARWMPIRVGKVPENAKLKNLTNISCRLISVPKALKAGETWTSDFQVFFGPKRPSLLANYNLDELVYYGWPIFAVFARPMQLVLHFFYSIIPNYGLAIILLTVLVRSCMYPISRKQALNAQKMQELQPEIKRIAEKYKNNLEARSKAQQELFKKHKYNPLSGCLPMFIQLPIFLGLYRSIGIDIELRQAALIPGLHWCSNLAAPDMLFFWMPYLPSFLASPTGYLGPYFNLLPILTVCLFIWQQKMFMPPPADEQAALQQKMMQYMMLFIGVMFFTVASGLCIYFIASSLWGIAERKLLPKPGAPGSTPTVLTVPSRSGGNGSPGGGKKKQRGNR